MVRKEALGEERIAKMVTDDTVVDVTDYHMFAEFYDLTTVWRGQDSNVDYRDMKRGLPIWSIGRHKSTGKIYGSLYSYFYLNKDFDCVWLR
jgi:hypothetical protein